MQQYLELCPEMQEMKHSQPVILASGSPRRRELISLAFENVRIYPADIEEKIDNKVPAEDVTLGLSLQKASHVSRLFPGIPVIGCDTVVIFDGEVMGKPSDDEDAFRMLRKLSGSVHTVSTGCSIVCGDTVRSFKELTRVAFWELSDDMIRSYIASGEPMDKAGAYGIQKLGSLLVRSLDGDYFNVVGLPVSRLYREFSDFMKCLKN